MKTSKGNELGIMTLKNKPYMVVAYRLLWLNDDVPNFDIKTEFLSITDEQTICQATVKVLDANGKFVKRATATKRETKKDFPDHTEKAETSSVGRALAMLGFGTQFAIQDLDEGDRIVDSPVAPPRSVVKKNKAKGATEDEF